MVETANSEARTASVRLSVCVAVYNVERYLSECLESLREQDFKNAEFLVVDDGSTDNSPAIIERFLDDPRFRLIRHATNKGTLVARKNAVLEARGDWILFMDGDDKLLRPDALAIIAELAVNNPADILQFRSATFEGDEALRNNMNCWVWGGEELNTPFFGSEDIFRRICAGKISWTLWNKVWRATPFKKAVAHLPNERFVSAEDAAITLMMALHAESFARRNTPPLYGYRLRSGISTQARIPDKSLPTFAKEVRLTRWIEQTLDEEHRPHAFYEALKAMRRALLEAKAWRIQNLANPKSTGHFFDLIMAEGFLPLWVNTLRQCWRKGEDKLAEALIGANSLKRKARPVKTIGLLYWRYFEGGAERVISLQIPMLLSLGYRIVLLTEQIAPEREFPLPTGVQRIQIPQSGSSERATALEAAIRSAGIDLMIYHQAWCTDLLWDLLVVKGCGIPLVLFRHELTMASLSFALNASTISQIIERVSICRLADKTVVLSSMEESFHRSQGINATYIPNLPTISLHDEQKPENTGKMRQGLVWIGRLESISKHYLDALRIMKRVIELAPGTPCLLIGPEYDPGSGEQVRAFIDQEGLGDKVSWIGHQADVSHYLKEAACLLVTSTIESFSMVIGESQACGTPLVTYEMPPLELLKSGKGFVAVPQRDIEAAAQAVAKIVSDDAEVERLSQEARDSFREFYEEAHIPESWARIIHECESPAAEPPARNEDLSLFFELGLSFIKTGLQGPEAPYHIDRKPDYDIRSLPKHLKWHLLSKIHPSKSKRHYYRDKLKRDAPGFDGFRHDLELAARQPFHRTGYATEQSLKNASKARLVLKWAFMSRCAFRHRKRRCYRERLQNFKG